MFFSDELKGAIKQGKYMSLCRDGLGYQVFKQAGDLLLEKPLALFNHLWENGFLPKEWKHATIIPLVKPGKQPSILDS